MIPFAHSSCNTTFGPPAGWTADKCNPLPLKKEGIQHTSYWVPDDNDKLILATGGCIALTVTGFQPVVMLTALEESPVDAVAGDAFGRIRQGTTAMANEIERRGLQSNEVPVALGMLASHLSDHSGVPLTVVLEMINKAAIAMARSNKPAPAGA